MRVIVHQHSYYDWEPVPAGTVVTEADIRSGRVKPDAQGLGHLMRVTKKDDEGDRITTVIVPESAIIHRLLHQMHPQQGRMLCSRKEAIAHLLADKVMPQHGHPKHIIDFEVEDDGPDEKLFAEIVKPFTEIVRGLDAGHSPDEGGEKCVDPEDYNELLAKYLEPSEPKHHADHFRQRFGVRQSKGASK